MKKKNIILISSSGGHYEQLLKLKELEIDYNLIWCTERTRYQVKSDHKFPSIKLKSIFFPFKLLGAFLKSMYLIIKYKPMAIVSTGALVAIPISMTAKLFRKKVVFIETFARVKEGTRTGKFMYKRADLFIVQWENLKEIYPDAIYGGSLY